MLHRNKWVQYDCIMLVVKDKGIADQIKKELEAIGVDTAKILWKEPIVLAD